MGQRAFQVFESQGIQAPAKNTILSSRYTSIVVGTLWDPVRIEWDMEPSFYDTWCSEIGKYIFIFMGKMMTNRTVSQIF